MTSSISSSNRAAGRRRRPLGLLLAAGLILLVELALALRPRPEVKDLVRHRFYNPNVKPDVAESIVQWQVAHASILNQRQDLLLLGDSACLGGLDAAALTEKTGLKTWNLGTFGFTYTEGHADILEFFIERNGPPRFLIYYTSYYPLSRGLNTPAVRSWLGRLRDWMAPPARSRRLLPSLSYRRELRNALWALGREGVAYAGTDLPRDNFPSDDWTREHLWANRGSLLIDAHEIEVEDRFDDGISWRPGYHPDSEGGLRRIAGIAREHDFPVLFLFSPLPELADNDAVRAQVADLEKNVEEIFRTYPRAKIYRPFLRFYPNDHCVDMRHLSVKGARRHTEEIAGWILANWR